MDIYSVTPQMERHMSSIEFYGSSRPSMHSVEEEEMANKYLDGDVKDIDDSFVYEELEDDDDVSSSPVEEEEKLLKVAAEDIVKKLVVSEPKIKPRAKKMKLSKSEETVKRVAVKTASIIMKGERYGGLFEGIL